MQMPEMARTVFMGGFIAPARHSVKTGVIVMEQSALVTVWLHKRAHDGDFAGSFSLTSPFRPNRSPSALLTSANPKVKTMPRSKQKAERKPAAPELVSHYRAIGPAAILAALICARKNRQASKSARKAA